MRKIARFINRWSAVVIALGVGASWWGGYYSVELYKNLRTDVEELLPTTARSIVDLNTVTSRLAAYESMVVLVFSPDKEASKRFMNDLGAKLSKVPKDTIASIEYRIDREIDFFKQRRSLFIDLPDLIRIRNYIRDRLNYEMELYNPLTFLTNANLLEPKLDYMGLRNKYESKVSTFDNLPGGYYANKDESLRLMVIYMPGKGIETALRMSGEVRKAVAELKPETYGNIQVKYTGNVQTMIEETAALVADLELSTILVVVLVAFVMWFFYRSIWGTIALNVALFMGTFWTFGLAYFLVGYLNANTAFLASIVIGNGINFGVIFLARYMEDRRSGMAHEPALESSMANTATSTGTAALAAGLSYGSLMLTGFRGFNQFGVIGFFGMVFCWAASYTMLPAFLSVIDRFKKGNWIRQEMPKPFISGTIANLVEKYPKPISLIAFGGVIAALMTLPLAKNGVIENDFSKLRDKGSMTHGAGSLYHHIEEVFGHSVSPMVIMPENREDAANIAELIRTHKEKEGASSLISSVQTLDDFIPKDQTEKIIVLKQIAKILKPEYLAQMAPDEKALVRELLAKDSMAPFTEEQLPELVKGKFREKDGSIGRIVLMDKKFDPEKDDIYDVEKFVLIGRRIADSVKPGTPVAGQLAVSFDLFKAIEIDGPRATFFAFLAVMLLMIILFRHIPTIAQTLFGLWVGIIWLVGLMLGFGLKINFLNFIALPITFGIGVDYAVNILQRYREVGADRIVEVVRNTGGAVMLASLTTIIGYGSLLLAGNQAFVSFGLLAVLGEVTCVTAAVVALPAFLRWRQGKRELNATQDVKIFAEK